VVELCVTNQGLDGVRLVGSVNGYPIITYLDPIDGAYQAGDPGLCMWDIGWVPDAAPLVDVHKVEVLTVSGVVPCEGPPENPYPHLPPPLPPPIFAYEYPHSRGAWRAPVMPTVPHSRGSYRTPAYQADYATKYIHTRGQWIPILSYTGDETPDPETEFPPFHDPCYLVPPIIPGDVIAIADRFFGISDCPIGSLDANALFDGTQKALGGWYVADLAYCAAHGATLLGGSGAKSATTLNGRWHLPTFIAGNDAKIRPIYSTLVSRTLDGSFFGYSCGDDLESAALWGVAGGAPKDEFAAGVAELRTRFPDIRIGARVRPGWWPFDPGLQFYTTQYHNPENLGPPGPWAGAEYAVARSRGAYMVYSVNYLNGGEPGFPAGGDFPKRYFNGTIKGSSAHNYMVSPTEVVNFFTAALGAIVAVDGTAEFLAGCLGYQYLEYYLSLADASYTVIEALTIAHNLVAGLPALP
jgi:hypothetical protein